jgi:hypothetical protein
VSGVPLRRPVAQVLAVAVVVLLLGSGTAASMPFAAGIEDGDLVASAQADADEPVTLDEAVQTMWPRGAGARADAVSTASATCDGCHARAVTVQVIRADRGWRWSADADNVATAWAACHDCTAAAVAVQVVLVGRAGRVDVDNRALAVTAGCTRCSVDAVAYQLVVKPDTLGDGPAVLQQRLLAWARTQPEALSPPPPGARTAGRQERVRPTHVRLAALETAVLDLVPGTVLRRDAKLRRSR